jgi:dTDP-4-dehydrorhamnose 3,5-epimerase
MTDQESAELDSSTQSIIQRQDYSSKSKIRDLERKNLKRFLDDGGEFSELGRINEKGFLEDYPQFEIKQVNYSLLYPGTIKAWHLHRNQEDLWFIPPTSRFLVGLLDCRADSDTNGVSMRFVMGDGHAELLYIPRGVAHGLRNIHNVPGAIFYFVNQIFTPTDTDELRLPWDHLGAIFWEKTPG